MAWKTFWFDTNSAWGMADSPEAWAAIRANWNKGAHGMKPKEIYTNNLSCDHPPRPGDVPNFGRRAEHIGGKITLGEFFDDNGMARNV